MTGKICLRAFQDWQSLGHFGRLRARSGHALFVKLGVLAKPDSARYRQLQHQELGRRPAPTCSPSKVAFFLRKKMWPVRQLNGTSHHGVMRSSLRRRGRE
jgi:hypothetical protein